MHRHLLLPPLFLLLFITLPLRADGLQVGTAVVDISPTVKPFQLRSGKSTYVHDPLHVRAVAFENGQGRAVIAVMDAIGVGREMCDEAKTAAAKVTGWKPEHMLIAGTHTHTAPKGGDTSPGRIATRRPDARAAPSAHPSHPIIGTGEGRLRLCRGSQRSVQPPLVSQARPDGPQSMGSPG